MATPKQLEYIAALFIDVGAHSAIQRKSFLYNRFQIKETDMLSTLQASKLIEELKELKETKNGRERQSDRQVDD